MSIDNKVRVLRCSTNWYLGALVNLRVAVLSDALRQGIGDELSLPATGFEYPFLPASDLEAASLLRPIGDAAGRFQRADHSRRRPIFPRGLR